MIPDPDFPLEIGGEVVGFPVPDSIVVVDRVNLVGGGVSSLRPGHGIVALVLVTEVDFIHKFPVGAGLGADQVPPLDEFSFEFPLQFLKQERNHLIPGKTGEFPLVGRLPPSIHRFPHQAGSLQPRVGFGPRQGAVDQSVGLQFLQRGVNPAVQGHVDR